MSVQQPSRRGRRRSIWGRVIACVPAALALPNVILGLALSGSANSNDWWPLLLALLCVALCIPAGLAAIVLGISAVRAGWRRGGRAAVVAGVCDFGAPLSALLFLLWTRATN